MKLIPKNWKAFQHYNDRCPPWIKLHRDLLNDRAFMSLPVASKALAPLMWLLASESKDGSFDASSEELAFRLRLSLGEVEAGLKPLINSGFFVDASTMLAPCLQVAIPEREAEGETETDIIHSNECMPETDVSDDDEKLDPKHVVDFWNQTAVTLGKPKVRDLTPERRQLLKARMSQYSIDDFVVVFDNIKTSPFLRGDNGWRGCTFDWVFKKANFQKILEGNYND
jgi:hypothetical protein